MNGGTTKEKEEKRPKWKLLLGRQSNKYAKYVKGAVLAEGERQCQPNETQCGKPPRCVCRHATLRILMDTGHCDRIPAVCFPGETKIEERSSLRRWISPRGMIVRCEQEGRKTKNDLKT